MPGFPSCVKSSSHLSCLSFSSPGVGDSLEGTGPASGPWRSRCTSQLGLLHSPLSAQRCAGGCPRGLGSRLLPSPAHSGLRLVTSSGFCAILDGPLHFPSASFNRPFKKYFSLKPVGESRLSSAWSLTHIEGTLSVQRFSGHSREVWTQKNCSVVGWWVRHSFCSGMIVPLQFPWLFHIHTLWHSPNMLQEAKIGRWSILCISWVPGPSETPQGRSCTTRSCVSIAIALSLIQQPGQAWVTALPYLFGKQMLSCKLLLSVFL